MHVLVIPSWYPESSSEIRGIFFREQAIALAKANCKVGVIYPQRRAIKNWYGGKFGFSEENDCGVVTIRRYGVKWLPLLPRGNTLLWLRDGRKLYRRYVKRFGRPDIVHAHSAIYAGVLAYKIYRWFGMPYVITEHSSAYARNMIENRQKQLAAAAVTLASRRFAVSESFCDLLEKYFGGKAGSWETLPNMVSQSFADLPLQSPKRQIGEFVFVSITALKKNKAVDDLINAFARAFPHQEGIRLVIGGDGIERPRLQGLVHQRELAGRIQFLGALNREQVIHQISVADAFVSSSLYETFGVALVEALALGKPVVATRCGGPDLIVREQDGVLVEPSDIDAMAEAMKDVHAHIDRYHPQEIRQACLSRYGEAVVVARLTEKYKEILEFSPEEPKSNV